MRMNPSIFPIPAEAKIMTAPTAAETHAPTMGTNAMSMKSELIASTFGKRKISIPTMIIMPSMKASSTCPDIKLEKMRPILRTYSAIASARAG